MTRVFFIYYPLGSSSRVERSKCYIYDNIPRDFSSTSTPRSRNDVTGGLNETNGVTGRLDGADDVTRLQKETGRGTDTGSSVECSSWTYDTSQYTSTIVTEVNLLLTESLYRY